MNSLPYELKLSIANSLSAKELLKLCETSSDINEICNDDRVWRKYFMKYYGKYMYYNKLLKWIGDRSWYEAFKEMYRMKLHDILPTLYLILTLDAIDTDFKVIVDGINKHLNITNDYEIIIIRTTMKVLLSCKFKDMIDISKGPIKLKTIPIKVIKRWLSQDIRLGKWDMTKVGLHELNRDDIYSAITKYQNNYHSKYPFTSCSTNSLDFYLSLDIPYKYDSKNEMYRFIYDSITEYEAECIDEGVYTKYDTFTVIKGGKRGIFNSDVINTNIRDMIADIISKDGYITSYEDRYYNLKKFIIYLYLVDSNRDVSNDSECIMISAHNDSIYCDGNDISYKMLPSIYNHKGDIVIATRSNFSDEYYRYVMNKMKSILRGLH